MNIRTIEKHEEHGTQYCNKKRAMDYCKSKNRYRYRIQHIVVKTVTYRNEEPVYCYTVVMK